MKSMMGKVMVILVMMMTGALLFTGCKVNDKKENVAKQTEKAGTESKDTKEDMSKEKKKEIELHFVQPAFTDDEQKEIFATILEGFEQETGIKIKMEYIPLDQYPTWVATQFTAGTPPDIIRENFYTTTDNYNKGLLLDISAYLEKESPYNPGQPWKDTFSKALFDRMYLEGEKGVPGVPTTTATIRVFYNMDLFKKVGISTPPTTWKEFIAVCEKLKAADIVPFAFPNSVPADCSWLWFNNSIANQLSLNAIKVDLDVDGSGFIEIDEISRGVDKGIIDFSKEFYAETFNLMKDFSKYWTSDYNSLDMKSAMEMFLRGEVAMGQFGSWDLKVIDNAEGRDFEFGVFPVPTITTDTYADALGKSIVLGGQPDGILGISNSVKGDKLDASLTFLQYMTSPEVQKQLLEKLYNLSSIENADLPEKLKGFIITEEQLILPYFTGVNTEARVFFHRAGQMFLSGEISVEKFGEVMTAEYKDIIDIIKAENGWTKDNNYGNK